MIISVGVDACQVDRLAAMLARRPDVLVKLFNPAEINNEAGRRRSHASLAARFAAKEALAKALGAPAGLAWRDAEVTKDGEGMPAFQLRGKVAARVAELGIGAIRLSMSHDGGLAIAFVVCEGES